MSGILGFAGIELEPATVSRLRATARLLQHRDLRDQAILLAGRSGHSLLALDSACEQPHFSGHSKSVNDGAAAMLVDSCVRVENQAAAGGHGIRRIDDQIFVACDGVIDNLPELLQDLKNAGCEPRCASQAEVLRAGFDQWGPECLRRLSGSFACAVADFRRRRVILARDVFGTRPLYYARENGREIFFASQIAALLELASLTPRINRASLYRYLAHNTMEHGAETSFAGVDQIPAGHYLEVSLDTPRQPFLIGYRRAVSASTSLTFDESVEHLRQLVIRAVDTQVRGHNRVGAALSGGFDSSFVAAAFKRGRPEADLAPYVCVPLVKDGVFFRSEEAWAELAATGLQAPLKTVRVSAGGLPDNFASLVRSQEEPFSSPVIFAQLQMFRAAQEDGIRVMLSGQGGDTMFATSPEQLLRAAMEHARGGQWRAAGTILRAGAQRSENNLQRLSLGVSRAVMPRNWQTFAKRLRRRPRLDWLKEKWFELDSPTLRQDSGLPMLRFEDRNAAACDILNRMPLLSPEIQDFVASLPARYLVTGDQPIKSLESAALRGMVPDAVLTRKERLGFPVPIREWLVELAPWVDMNVAALKRLPFFEADRVSQLWDSVQSGNASLPAAFLIWRWVFLAGWMQVFNVSLD